MQSFEPDYFQYNYKNRQKSKTDIFDSSTKNDGTAYHSRTPEHDTPHKQAEI